MEEGGGGSGRESENRGLIEDNGAGGGEEAAKGQSPLPALCRQETHEGKLSSRREAAGAERRRQRARARNLPCVPMLSFNCLSQPH